MKRLRNSSLWLVLAPVLWQLASCSVPLEQVAFEEQASQLQVRNLQSRTYEAADRIQVLRAVIATLQDLDFVLDLADSRLGLITATRLHGYTLKVTIMVQEREGAQQLVRVSCQLGPNAVTDPQAYQEFFASLEKNLFLSGQQTSTLN